MSHNKFRLRQPAFSAFVRLLTCLAICLPLMPAKSQEKVQTRPPVDEGDVLTVSSNLVNFDVTVRDKKGKVVTDLKADDFTVVENGVRQKIEFFDATLAGTNKSGAPAATTDNPSPSRLPPTGLPRNVVSLVLDAQTTESINLKAVRDGIINYVRDRVTTDDSVALFAIAGGLQLLQPFTQDKEKLISAVERAGSLSSGPKSSELRDINSSIADLRDRLSAAPSDPVTIAAGGSAAAQIMISRRVLEQYVQLRSALSVQQTRPVLAALAAICEGLRPVPGKKTLVMFSQGFVAPEALDWQVQSTIDIANRANVSIYIIDSTGLKGGTPQSGALVPTSALSGISAATSQESRIRAGAGESVFDTARYEGLNRQQDLLYQISGDTGGQFIKNTNDISEGLNRIDNEIRSRYTLAYRSTDPNFDGRFRKVKIEVQRSGVNVVARPGYYAIPPTQVVPFSPEDRELLANFNKFEEHSTLPLSVELNAFRAMQGLYVVPLSFEIPPEAVTFDKKAGKQQLQLDVIGVVKTQGSDKILSRLGGNFNVSLSPQQYESILNDKIYYRQDIELGEGSYTIDLVVKDRLSGKVAAKREKLVLPVADSELSVTNAILSRHATVFTPSLVGPPDVLSAGNVQIRPSPSREFRSSDNLIIFFKVYNAATVPQTGKPLVKVTVTLLRDGKAATKPFDYELTDAVKEGIPHLTFAKYIKLQGLAAGKYTALIETTDMVRQKTMRQESLFAITP